MCVSGSSFEEFFGDGSNCRILVSLCPSASVTSVADEEVPLLVVLDVSAVEEEPKPSD